MKILLIIFMVIMTAFYFFGKYMPLEKVKPFFFNKFPEKYAKLLFNFCGALLIASCVLYVVLTIVFLWNASIEIVVAIGTFFFLKDVGRIIKDKK